jgi:hypothetical protein
MSMTMHELRIRSRRLFRARLPMPVDPMVATVNLAFRPTAGVQSTETRAGSVGR